MKKQTCHDCGVQIQLDGDKVLNGLILKFKDELGEYIVFKCNGCYKKDKSLRNFRECEVYSRIVGYLRPVQQWNVGKKQEWGDRVEYSPFKKVNNHVSRRLEEKEKG